MGQWWRAMRVGRLSGAWMRWHWRPKRRASVSNAARSAVSCSRKGCGGGRRTVGARLATRTLSAIRTAVVTHYTEPPEGSTTVCTDELGPVVPRTFDPAPGWSPTGHRIKAPLDYERGPEKTWVYGALRVCDGKELTRCALSRNSKGYIALRASIEADNPTGDIFVITDNLSSHNSLETRTWLEEHPRIHQVFIPTGACWLNAARRAGGASSAAMHWLDRVLPIPRRSSKPPASRRLNSIYGPNPGSGDALPRRIDIAGVSFVTAFKELS